MDIFVSYSRRDKDSVFAIVENIRKNTGLDLWIDLEGVEGGDHFDHNIINAINQCKVVLFMMSKSSIAPFRDPDTGEEDHGKSTWTEMEVQYALNRNKRVVLVSIDGSTTADSDWFDFHCSKMDVIDYRKVELQRKLCKNLREWVGQEQDDREFVRYLEKRPDNYFMLCVLAVISPGAPLGLYAMYCSYKVHSLYNKRLYNEANKMSARTKLMATISLAIGLFLYMAFSMTVMAITIVKFSK